MSKADDNARAEIIYADPLADAIFRFIEGVPAASRLYPDLYVLELVDLLRKSLLVPELWEVPDE